MKASFGGTDRKTILENYVRSKEAAIAVLKYMVHKRFSGRCLFYNHKTTHYT